MMQSSFPSFVDELEKIADRKTERTRRSIWGGAGLGAGVGAGAFAHAVYRQPLMRAALKGPLAGMAKKHISGAALKGLLPGAVMGGATGTLYDQTMRTIERRAKARDKEKGAQAFQGSVLPSVQRALEARLQERQVSK